MEISTKTIIDTSEINVVHSECSDPGLYKSKPLFVESNGNNNTLSVVSFNDSVEIYVYWESFEAAKQFDIAFVPETGILFIGCGTLSVRLCTKSYKLLDISYPELFWSLKRHKEYILELGELECFLYSLDGKQISSAAVDPPYEMEVFDHGIKFESIVVGTTWLEYLNE